MTGSILDRLQSMMAADKLKKLESKGRTAFIQGDISAATRFFTQALEKYSNWNHGKSPEPKQRKITLRSKSRSMQCVNNNDEEQVWILQSRTNAKRNKIGEKLAGKKKEDKEKISSLEMLDGIVADAETAITTYPSYPIGYLRKASALILLNRWEEARKTYITGLAHCRDSAILKSALLNLNRTNKITSCAANLDLKQLADLVNQNDSNHLPATPTLRRNKFRLQSQRRLTKKLFPGEEGAISSHIQTTIFRRRNSSSTDTRL